MLQFNPVTQKDILTVKVLQPDGWPDITEAFKKYIDWKHCYPLKVADNGIIVGLGTYIVFGNSAWLAHIIVHKDHRNKGIGFQIVEHLMKCIEELPVQSILLIATELGEPVYKKAGFRIVSDYLSLKRNQPWKNHPVSENIQPFHKKYNEEILNLDFRISGENRKWLMKEHLDKALACIENETITGVYLPDLGEGAIYADNATSGTELMKMKYKNTDLAVIPAENKTGIEFLLNNGFIHNGIKGKRMVYGKDINWKPEGFFSRIGGNFG